MSETAKCISTIQEKLISFGNHVILLVCLLNVDTILKVKGTLDVRGNKYAGEKINTMEPPVINKVHMYSLFIREEIIFLQSEKATPFFAKSTCRLYVPNLAALSQRKLPLSSREASTE